MKKILIFAPFPQEKNIKDGKIQRINSIDSELCSFYRIYIEVSLRRYFLKSYHGVADNEKEYYRLNFFTHFFALLKLLSSTNNIYIHSLYNYVHLLLFSFHGKNVIVDLHGAVPEEREFMGNSLLSKILNLIENRMFSVCNFFICVSEEMKQYYMGKYPQTKESQFLIKPIYSSNAMRSSNIEEVDMIKKELNIKETDVVFVYSGNLQKWQNIDMMIDLIGKDTNPNHFFLFLTGEEENFRNIINRSAVKNLRYEVRCVSPNDLNIYYELANYGFILRDEHILNRVAAPTKLVEYLYFGIIPIVKYERIGDSFLLGYEYISCNEDLTNLPKSKSLKNKEVAKKLLMGHDETKISELLK